MSKRLQELEYFAQKFRDDNSLSEKEPIRIKSILQKNNILTVYKPLSSGLSGMSIKIKSETKKGEIDDNSIRFILVNSKHSIGKQHFTICHELYHLYFQEKFSSSISIAGKFDKKGNPEEYDADLFAMTLHGFRLYAFVFLINGVNIWASSFFTALNNGVVSGMIAFLRTLLFQIGCIMLLPLVLGLNGIWMGVVVAEMLTLIVTIYFLRSRRKVYHY